MPSPSRDPRILTRRKVPRFTLSPWASMPIAPRTIYNKKPRQEMVTPNPKEFPKMELQLQVRVHSRDGEKGRGGVPDPGLPCTKSCAPPLPRTSPGQSWRVPGSPSALEARTAPLGAGPAEAIVCVLPGCRRGPGSRGAVRARLTWPAIPDSVSAPDFRHGAASTRSVSDPGRRRRKAGSWAQAAGEGAGRVGVRSSPEHRIPGEGDQPPRPSGRRRELHFPEGAAEPAGKVGGEGRAGRAWRRPLPAGSA